MGILTLLIPVLVSLWVLKVTEQILFSNVSHPVSSSEMMFEILFDQVSVMASSFFYGDSKKYCQVGLSSKRTSDQSVAGL